MGKREWFIARVPRRRYPQKGNQPNRPRHAIFTRRIAQAALLAALLSLSLAPTVHAQRRALEAARVSQVPSPEEPGNACWAAAQALTLRDAVAAVDITLKAVHDGERVAIQASFPDPTENRMHRMLVWDPAKQAYRDGPEREDALVLKWSMSDHETGLTLHEDAPYVADVWFWKAHRTDPSGYADDKIDIYSITPEPYAKAILSRSGKIFYLTRKGDDGDDPAETVLYPGYSGDRVPKFALRPPSGSRADIRAKGFWKDGWWTVTFVRKLVTGHSDDVALRPGGEHPFGVSRFEIAGRPPEPGAEEPLFGCGDVGEILVLRPQR